METFSYQLTKHLPCQKTVIARGSRQWHIVWVAPLLFWKSLWYFRQADVFHFGDLVLAPVAVLVKLFTSKPVVITAHGLELTHGNGLLKALINLSLPFMDAIVAVSRYTAGLLVAKGVPKKKIQIITHGVVPPRPIAKQDAQKEIADRLRMPQEELRQRFLLLSVGRLVERKGVAWFIERVLPQLVPMNPLLCIASSGPDKKRIEETIHRAGLEHYVRLLGSVSEFDLSMLYSGSDVFVMPNIRVPNDAEGFGFTSIEATSYGLTVVASRLEGIPDAIHHQKNGLLAEPGNAEEFARIIGECYAYPEDNAAFGKQAREYTIANFNWERVAERYLAIYKKVARLP